MKCLIADDDPRIRRMIKSVLERPNLEFLEAQNGEEAVTLYRAYGPELVIMDVEMSRMDGIAATRAICEQDPLCKVLILSQHDSASFRHAAAAAGALSYILKDDLQSILDVLAAYLPP